jgi:hypothetical protein
MCRISNALAWMRGGSPSGSGMKHRMARPAHARLNALLYHCISGVSSSCCLLNAKFKKVTRAALVWISRPDHSLSLIWLKSTPKLRFRVAGGCDRLWICLEPNMKWLSEHSPQPSVLAARR